MLRYVPDCSDPLPSPHPYYLLLEISVASFEENKTMKDLLTSADIAGITNDAIIAMKMEEAMHLWRLRKEISGSQRAEGASIKHDISLPVSRLAEFISEASTAVEVAIPNSRLVAFGHLGDGNLHFNVSQPAKADRNKFLAKWRMLNRAVHDIVMSMDGSFSAEHGIGRLKLDDLIHYRSTTEVNLMRGLKSTLDPKGILNPGKVLKPS